MPALKLLLDYYNSLGAVTLEGASSGSDEGTAQTSASRNQATSLSTVENLSVLREARHAMLQQARQEFEGLSQLFNEGLIPQADVDTSKAAVAECETAIDELDAKIERLGLNAR